MEVAIVVSNAVAPLRIFVRSTFARGESAGGKGVQRVQAWFAAAMAVLFQWRPKPETPCHLLVHTFRSFFFSLVNIAGWLALSSSLQRAS